MRIISPFHDYYDSAMGAGVDDTSLFLRRPLSEDIPQGHAQELWQHPFRRWVELASAARIGSVGSMVVGQRNRELFVEPGLILFAGTLYPFMAMRELNVSETSAFGWSVQEVQDWLATRGEKLSDRKSWWMDKKTDEQRAAEWFALRGLDATPAMAVAQVAIAVIEDHGARWGQGRAPGTVTVNPCLAPYDFARQLDPWTAYQNLAMFVEGVLRHPDPLTIPITDKDRLVQHGFDRWSFKTMPAPLLAAPRKKPQR